MRFRDLFPIQNHGDDEEDGRDEEDPFRRNDRIRLPLRGRDCPAFCCSILVIVLLFTGMAALQWLLRHLPLA